MSLFQYLTKILGSNKQDVIARYERERRVWESERVILVDEIERYKHMTGVQQKLFNNIRVFRTTFMMVKKSTVHLLGQATKDTRFALVAEIEAIKIAHLMFVMEIYERFSQMANPDCVFSCTCGVDSPLPSYLDTEFGKWYYGEGRKLDSHEAYRAVDALYKRFHTCAAEAIELFESRDYLDGVDKVNQLDQTSTSILNSLETLAVTLMENANASNSNGTTS